MLTVLEGSSFLVADDLGNVCGGTDGLYCDDVRALSRWRVLVDGSEPTLLTAGARDHASAAVFAQHHGGSPSHPSRVAVMRELFVSRDSLQERLVVENGSRSPRPVVVSYEFDADFLDIFEVKSLVFGERDLTFAKRITPLYTARDYDPRERVFRFSTGGDGFACTSLIWFSQPGIPGDREAHFEIEVPARGRWELACNVVVLSGEKARDGAYTTTYFEEERTRVRDSLKRWLRDAPTLDGGVERVGHVYRKSLDDLAALRMHPPGKAESALPAAGLPWFMTVFGRDSLITSFQSMPIDDSFARAALRTLGALQAHADDPERDAEPGKILHEMRFGKVAALTGQFPYYGSVDATPLYLIVLSELWRWTRDDAIVVELEPIARRALAWMDGPGDPDGDGFLEFHRRSARGLEVQSWKDSWDSMQFRDGTLARSPLAVAEVQGYAFAARVRMAELAREVWNDPALADQLERDAAALRVRFDEQFWVERDGHGYYALALDADKRPVDALTSNTAQLLFTGIAQPERIPAIVRATMSERLFSGWGIRSMASDSGGYDPIGYHTGTVWPHDTSLICYGLARAGYRDESFRLSLGLLEAAEHYGWRLPEVIAGYPRAQTVFPIIYPTSCSPQAWASAAPVLCLRAVLGIEPDPLERTLRVDPYLRPRGRTNFTWDGIPAFGRTWKVDVRGYDVSVTPR